MVHINIGSNLGNREANVARAAEILAERLGITDIRRAPLEYSAPWGYESACDYVNLGIAFEAGALTPDAILQACRAAERAISTAPHRHSDGSYADRLVDVDIIAIGDMNITTPSLTIPHPRMHLRAFVLRPMDHIDPSWRHPILGLTPAQLLKKFGE